MDVLRPGSCYRCQIRPFKDSDETVTIQWYPARPEAKYFPLPHAFGSSVWLDRPDDKIWNHVGEVPNTREYIRNFLDPGYLATCFMGKPDQWLGGLVQADMIPEIAIPECCRPHPKPPIGGTLRIIGAINQKDYAPSGRMMLFGASPVTSRARTAVGGPVTLRGPALVASRANGPAVGLMRLRGLVTPLVIPANDAGFVIFGDTPVDSDADTEPTGKIKITGKTSPSSIASYTALWHLRLYWSAPIGRVYDGCCPFRTLPEILHCTTHPLLACSCAFGVTFPIVYSFGRWRGTGPIGSCGRNVHVEMYCAGSGHLLDVSWPDGCYHTVTGLSGGEEGCSPFLRTFDLIMDSSSTCCNGASGWFYFEVTE